MSGMQQKVDFTESINLVIDDLEQQGYITDTIEGANNGRVRLMKKNDNDNIRLLSFVGENGAVFNFEICLQSLAANTAGYIGGLFEVLDQSIIDIKGVK
ncbi:hypothetical protein [Photobacterium damselae]|uniref:hypothetical protein n=1 Tax=Photobacterium damselae TaxID=38293 RepID=UPI001F42AF3C|nr:hypothetical protein [Photobacterium damselae]UKA12924.1 hypothetical protein IHC91_21640 [Photobacterium damselae subsp. damselae]